jgi:hypothetical protein
MGSDPRWARTLDGLDALDGLRPLMRWPRPDALAAPMTVSRAARMAADARSQQAGTSGRPVRSILWTGPGSPGRIPDLPLS